MKILESIFIQFHGSESLSKEQGIIKSLMILVKSQIPQNIIPDELFLVLFEQEHIYVSEK